MNVATILMRRFAVMPGWMAIEGMVNAMWDAILNVAFPTNGGNYLIGPEVRTINGDYRADLAVYSISGLAGNLSRRVVVVYEGKREGAGADWPSILLQCKNWTSRQDEDVVPQNGCVWFIGAIGSRAKLWVCKRTGASQDDFHTKALCINAVGEWSNGNEDNAADGFEFNLASANDLPLDWLTQALTHASGHLFNTYSWTA